MKTNLNNTTQTVQFSPEMVRQAAEQTAAPQVILAEAISRLESDPGAIFEDTVLNAARTLRETDEAAYYRLRAKVKGLKVKLDELTAPERRNHEDNMLDHVVQIARDRCDLCHDADGRGVALIEQDGVQQVWYVDGQGFRDWLRSAYFKEALSGIPDAAIASAIGTLAAIGIHQGEQVQVHIRCAKHEGAYYIDLCNDKWQSVRIDAKGWTIMQDTSVLFTRTKTMRPLPAPAASGNLEQLWSHVNVPESDRPITLAWTLESLRPDTPFAILEMVGEQGSAKSTTQRKLRALIDPNKVSLRGRPKTVEDIFVSAANNWIVSFENLSSLTAEQQDALCTLATGGGYASRQFYTNGEEHVLETKRPVMLNGISGVASRPDLIERTVQIEAPNIPSDKRQDESKLELAWQVDYPIIFGGLLDLFSATLAKLPEVNLPEMQRMADFQMLGEAMVMAQGGAHGDFSLLYAGKVADGVDRSLDAFGVANAIQVFMIERNGKPWHGTVLALYVSLQERSGADRSNWPKSARGLSGQLKRLAPGLRCKGIHIEHVKKSNKGAGLVISLKNPEP